MPSSSHGRRASVARPVAYDRAVGDDGGSAGDIDPDAPWKPPRTRSPTRTIGPRTRPTAPPGRPAQHEPPSAPSPWSRAAEADRPVVRRDPAEAAMVRRRERAARPAAVERPVATADGAVRSTATGEVVAVGIGLLVALTIGIVGVIGLAGGGADGVTTGARTTLAVLPDRVDVRWRVAVDERVQRVALDADGVAMVTGSSVRFHDRTTGDQRWTRPISDSFADVSFVDGAVAIIERRAATGTSTIALVDAATGDVRWSRSSLDSDFLRVDGSLFERSTERRPRRIRLDRLAPATGIPDATTIVDERIDAAPPHLASPAGDRARLHLAATLEPASVAVDTFELQAIALVGDSVVGFDADAAIVAFDATGRRSDQRPFVGGASGGVAGRAVLVGGVPEHDVGIVAGGTSLGFRVVDGRIEEAWTVSGRVGPPVATERGPVSPARVVDPASGEIDIALVDPVDGRQLAVTDAGVTRELDPVVAWNGYLVAPQIGAAERIVAAFDFEGRERWRLTLPPGASFDAGQGLVAVVERDVVRDVVTVYG